MENKLKKFFDEQKINTVLVFCLKKNSEPILISKGIDGEGMMVVADAIKEEAKVMLKEEKESCKQNKSKTSSKKK